MQGYYKPRFENSIRNCRRDNNLKQEWQLLFVPLIFAANDPRLDGVKWQPHFCLVKSSGKGWQKLFDSVPWCLGPQLKTWISEGDSVMEEGWAHLEASSFTCPVPEWGPWTGVPTCGFSLWPGLPHCMISSTQLGSKSQQKRQKLHHLSWSTLESHVTSL